MRLFVAVVPPPAALNHLDAACAPLRPGPAGLRWAGAERWHITLAFLGEVAEDRLGALRPRLERAARRHRACPLSLAGGGAFPGPARASVLWAGVAGDRQELADLARSVSAGARRAGALAPDTAAADEGRRFQPHLTLARSRPPADLRRLTAALSAYQGTPWTAQEIILFRSELGGGAPRYSVVGAWPLRPPGNDPPLRTG